MPSIIHTATRYHLFDESDLHRKNHTYGISRLGGVAIFCGFIISVLIFAALFGFRSGNFLLAGCVVLFCVGLKDDIYGMGVASKFLIQLCICLFLPIFGDFRLTSLYGVFNVWDIGLVFSILFSALLILFICNAFNLIDGVDGLAGTIGALVNLSFGLLLAIGGETKPALAAFAMFGACVGFLIYNFYPAKIFMGDTGALVIGLVSVAMSIKFIELNKIDTAKGVSFYSAPAIAVAVLIVPIFDTLRVFTIRLWAKKSPFQGDRMHIHHRLQNLGLNPKQIVLITVFCNILLVASIIALQQLGNYILIIIIISICLIFDFFVSYLTRRQKKPLL